MAQVFGRHATLKMSATPQFERFFQPFDIGSPWGSLGEGEEAVHKPQSSHAEKTFLGPTDELIKPQGMSHIEIPDQRNRL